MDELTRSRVQGCRSAGFSHLPTAMSTNSSTRAWLEISSHALVENYRAIVAAVGPTATIIPAVKADAYGLGMPEVVRRLEPEEPGAYGVATVDEGALLRTIGITRPIHLLSPLPPGDEDRAVQQGLVVTASELSTLHRLRDAATRQRRSVEFQIEVDTGMGRAGFADDQVADWGPALEEIAVDPLRWIGAFTHFHSAEIPDSRSMSVQWDRFRGALDSLSCPEPRFLVHAANSAAAIRGSRLRGNAVRPGIWLYGGGFGDEAPAPRPVVALRGRVVHVRDASPGATVGYGATYAAETPERWATIAIGYGDGLPRSFGNGGVVLLAGVRVPVVGRISMDMMVVDITHVAGVETGAMATVIGSDPDGGDAISLDEVAEVCGTISYEVLTGFTRRLPRVWTAEEPVHHATDHSDLPAHDSQSPMTS